MKERKEKWFLKFFRNVSKICGINFYFLFFFNIHKNKILFQMNDSKKKRKKEQIKERDLTSKIREYRKICFQNF